LKDAVSDLVPGVDYEVKDGGIDWLPFPKCPSTQHFRHTWVLVRRAGPKVPVFFGAPVPRHSPGEHQRAAAIVMAYFHIWTSRKDDADEHVKSAGSLREANETWQEAVQKWVDSNILCGESKQYVGNFLSVHRMRPRDDDEDDCNSQDIVSDEELEISKSSLAEALISRIGGKDQEGEEEKDDESGPSHYQNSAAAMAMNEEIWAAQLENSEATIPSFIEPQALNDVFTSAKQSQKREHMYQNASKKETRDPTLRELLSATGQDVQDWLEKKKNEKNEDGEPVVHEEQFLVLQRVAQRVMIELRQAANGDLNFGDPLCWLVHGGPGTGKSHVIKQIKKLFTDVLHWKMGVEYQVVALQAVMADLLGGDTIHHACGIPVMKKGMAGESQAQRQMDVAKRVLQWRWLIIDEISMVSAKLFAEVDVKLRSTVRQVGTQKLGGDMVDRPFGGLNVLCCGDFWRLDPPMEDFLPVFQPSTYKPRANTRQHQLSPMGKLSFGVGPRKVFKAFLN